MMTHLSKLRAFSRAKSGATAAEFVLIAPIMVALILFTINAGLLMYTGAMLNYAAAHAARCGAVRISCRPDGHADNTATRSYAFKQYGGFTIAENFIPDVLAPCGVKVDAIATYRVALGIASFNIPLEATACYPRQPTV